MTRYLNRDLLNMADPRRVANGTMAVVDALQPFTPEQQLPALAAAFILLAEHYGVPAQDAFTITGNIMKHSEGRRPEFAAAAAYMKGEL